MATESIMTRGGYVIEGQIIDNLVREGKELLEQYEYTSGMNYPTDFVPFIVTSSIREKAASGLIDLLSVHPNWNPDKLQIVFDSDWHRGIDGNVVEEILLECKRRIPIPLVADTVYTAHELQSMIERLDNLIYSANRLMDWCVDVVNLDKLHAVKEDLKRFSNLKNEYGRSYGIMGSNYYNKEELSAYKKYRALFEELYCMSKQQVLNENHVQMFERFAPHIKGIQVGLRYSKAFAKLTKACGVDKTEGFGKMQARLGDAINPLNVTRYTVISCNPIDYWTMSFGDNWCSCHNIDKTHIRHSSQVGMYGDGCCSSGTESYMLDGSSVVFYTVDKSYVGTSFELQDKHTRQMYHIDVDGKRFVQGRLYPQGQDGATEAYTEVREIVQKVLADCWKIDNMWVLKRGCTSACDVIDTYGTHYADYAHFDQVTLSTAKENAAKMLPRIRVGHNPICPGCGNEHRNTNNIVCSSCQRETFYCEYHDRDEIDDGDTFYINNYGRICREAYEEGNFFRCERCDDYYCEDNDEMIETTDGSTYCCARCARGDGYRRVGDEWYPEDEVYECEHCGEYYLIDDDDAIETENEIHFCCRSCAENAGFVETYNGDWIYSNDAYECEFCGRTVPEDEWNEERGCCNDCVEHDAE